MECDLHAHTPPLQQSPDNAHINCHWSQQFHQSAAIERLRCLIKMFTSASTSRRNYVQIDSDCKLQSRTSGSSLFDCFTGSATATTSRWDSDWEGTLRPACRLDACALFMNNLMPRSRQYYTARRAIFWNGSTARDQPQHQLSFWTDKFSYRHIFHVHSKLNRSNQPA